MRSRVRYKLIAAVGAAAALVIGVFAYAVHNAYQQRLIGNLEGYAHQISETVKSSTRHAMLLNQRESVHRTIDAISRQEGIEKIRVFNKDGAIIFSTDTAEVHQRVDLDAEACYACHAADQPLESVPISARTRIFRLSAESRTLGIINPIYNEPSCWQSDCHAHRSTQKVLGVLDITLPLEAIDREQRANDARLLVLTLLAIAAISAVIYGLTGRIVLRPVAEVVDATQRVAAGDLAATVPVREDDELGRLAASFNDMTRKLSEAQRQLFQSDKLASVGRLAAGVAHEINNPLTGVLTYSSFLLARANGDPETKEDLEVIVRETKRCREIVKGLLDFARQSVAEKRAVSLAEIVHSAARIVHNQLAIHKTRLILDFEHDLPPVHADANQVEQVLVNLLVNAGDAMPKEGGTITVQTAHAPEDDGMVRLVVRDTGSGIAPEALSHIYEPFFTTKGQKGTGLGLAIVWGIVEEHGGRIDVESEPGRGTTFTIRLPVARAIAGGPP